MRDFQPGDIAACYGMDPVSRTISYGTGSLFGPRRLRLAPSHVAIIAEQYGSPVWVESTTFCPHSCLIQRRRVRGMQMQLPEMRVQDYARDGGHVDVYRLSPIDRLSTDESELLRKILVRHFVGKAIQYDTAGALISGTHLFKYSRLLPGADLNKLFCSEVIAAVLMRLGRMNRSNPMRFNPGSLLRRLVRNGTYGFVRSYDAASPAAID